MYYDYRETLKKKLEDRMIRNPSYSLRSFARDLEVSVGRLSEVINKKKGTTVAKGLMITKNLGLTSTEAKIFLLSIEALHSRSLRKKEYAINELFKYQKNQPDNKINEKKFTIISNWYHYAILELLGTSEVFSKAEQISKRLGITHLQSEQALARLQELNLIEKRNGNFVVLTETTFTTNDVPSDALKQHHKENLMKAIDALYSQKVEHREISSSTIAIAEHQVAEFKQLLRDFRQKIASLADQAEHKDRVYLIGNHFFRLDKEL